MKSSSGYYFTRLLIIRGLGFIYGIVFLIIINQSKLLWGNNGLLPINQFIQKLEQHFGDKTQAFWNLPSLFYFIDPNSSMLGIGIIGLIGALFLMAGYANVFLLAGLWSLQLSFVNSGQLFYGYGWETLLLEFTFLCIFMVPFWRWNLRTSSFQPPILVIWALRWLLFRLMFGAGLIKLRGDDCWTELTCLLYHYETQPNPHPLSYFFHQMPSFVHTVSLLFNHFVELIVPFGILGSRRRWRYGAGLLIAVFQILLITSGNLAWFNWISLVITLACFDDLFFQGLGLHSSVRLQPPLLSHRWRPLLGNLVLFVGLLFLSVKPTINLFLPNQAMNASYDQWHFVNSYGAFGSIGKERLSIVISGSNDGTNWKEYQLPCASDALAKRPCLITPYHYHLDWQMWFSAMRPQLQEEWLFRFAVRLLENHPIIQDSLAEHPFSAKAPKLIKMDLYRYHFGSWEDWPKSWWRREFIRPYLSPISLETPEAKNYLSEPES